MKGEIDKMCKKLIWTSSPDFNDWKDDLQDEYPDATEEELWGIMYERNMEYLEDEKGNLSSISLDRNVLVIADLGLWNGRRTGYNELKGRNLGDCLTSFCSQSEVEYFVDKRGDLCLDETHHDGTNHIIFRMWKDNVSDIQKGNLLNKIYEQTYTRKDVTRLTERLGNKVEEVYGW